MQFVGLSGYEYPHTRVRCYRFADALKDHGYRTRVFSFHDRLASALPEAAMYGLSDFRRLRLVAQAATRLARVPDALLYIQKLHYHALAPLLLHRTIGIPYVLDYDDWEVGHDPYGVPLFCGFKDRRLTRALFGSNDPERILRRVAHRARFAVCASRFLADRVGECTEHVAYVPTGVDTSRFHARRRDHEGVVILWNGVVWGEMIRDNVVMLLECLPPILRERPDVVVRIVGDGAYMDEVRRAAENLGVGAHVQFVGWVHPDAMPDELARADIGAMPAAHADPWTRAKSPTKLFEYMAAGLAVVVMAGGEASYVVEHGRSGLVAADARAFGAGLLSLVRNDDLRHSFGRAARARVEEQFSLPVLGARLAQWMKRRWR